MSKNKLLIEGDRPMLFQPALALVLGSADEAVVLQQLHWLIKESDSGRIIEDKKWVWNTYEEWQSKFFPWMSIMKVRRIINKLEKLNLLLSCQPDGGFSRKKYYTVNYDTLNGLEKNEKPCVQNEQTICSE